MLQKVISGGQTGVDQAALRVAREFGLEIGGWCPPGRVCEDGTIPAEFPLRETPAERSPDAGDVPRSLRTEWNVRDADATLVLSRLDARPESAVDPGTAWTRRVARQYEKPLIELQIERADAAETLIRRLAELEAAGLEIRILNVAGPAESAWPGVGKRVESCLRRVLDSLAGDRRRPAPLC